MSAVLNDPIDAGDDDDGANNTPAPEPAPEPAAPPPAAKSFLESLPEDLRGHEAIKTFKDPESLARSYTELKSLQGNMVRLPGKDATPEARAEFFKKFGEYGNLAVVNPEDETAMSDLYAKLGRPEKPEGYTFADVEVPEGYDIDTSVHDALRPIAHANGVSAKAYQEMADAFNKVQLERVTAEHKAHEAAQDALQRDWGETYDSRIGLVRAFLNEHTPEAERDGLANELDREKLSNMPAFGKLVYELAKKYGEPSFVRGGDVDAQGGTLDNLQAQHAEVLSNPAYMNQNAPQHSGLVRKAAELMDQIVSLENRLKR